MSAATDMSDAIARVCMENLTYLSEANLRDLSKVVQDADRAELPGMIIEAGAALGGSAIIMALAKAPHRPMRVYDAFAMIPPPSDKDGEDVHRRYAKIVAHKAKGIGGTVYYGYRDDLLAEVRQSFVRYGIDLASSNVELIKGYFNETLRVDAPVAVAHLDGDWYESTMTCLERIEPHLVLGGRLIIDDYYKWSGCRRAVDEFFNGREGFEFVKHSRLHIVKKSAASRPHRRWWRPWSR